MDRMLLYSAVVATLVALPIPVRAQTLPASMSERAAEHGCQPLSTDFYDRPGPVHPPYVYGVFPGRWEDMSGAFWCRNNEGGDYKLVFINRGDTEVRCPLVLAWARPPRGLRVGDENVPLDSFRYVSDSERLVAPGDTTTYPPLVDTYDGVSTLFYCHEEDWVYKRRH